MPIEVSNYCSGDTVTFSLPLLVGCVTPAPSQGSIIATNVTVKSAAETADQAVLSSGTPVPADTSSWPIFNTHFKVLVALVPGENILQLEYDDEELRIILYYVILPITRFVRPIYIVCSDDDGQFQAPDGEDCSVQSACDRIAVGSRLMQTFMAAKLAEHGLGNKTFTLEKDLYPDRPACHVFRSKLKLGDVYGMSGGELWIAFAKELMSCADFDHRNRCKWLAFMSFTRYEPPDGLLPKSHSQVLQFTKGHTALGGGGLALFGTGTLHTWAPTVSQVVPCFTDARKIDRARFMDDSAYRETYWANYSTGLGAALHELGHTFDLAHTPTGVMARGFDDLYRVFTVQPLYSRRESVCSESRTASPISYSPRQSPVHTARKRFNSSCSDSGSRCSSPVYGPNFNSLPRTRTRTDSGGSGTSEVPPYNTFQIESDFRKLSVQTTQSFTVKNYDGSETRRTVSKYRDGMETVAEVTRCPSGQEVVKETITNLVSGRTRTVLSMTCVTDRNVQSKKLGGRESGSQNTAENRSGNGLAVHGKSKGGDQTAKGKDAFQIASDVKRQAGDPQGLSEGKSAISKTTDPVNISGIDQQSNDFTSGAREAFKGTSGDTAKNRLDISIGEKETMKETSVNGVLENSHNVLMNISQTEFARKGISCFQKQDGFESRLSLALNSINSQNGKTYAPGKEEVLKPSVTHSRDSPDCRGSAASVTRAQEAASEDSSSCCCDKKQDDITENSTKGHSPSLVDVASVMKSNEEQGPNSSVKVETPQAGQNTVSIPVTEKITAMTHITTPLAPTTKAANQITTPMAHITTTSSGPSVTSATTQATHTTTAIAAMPAMGACKDGILGYRPRRKDGGAHWYRASAIILSYHKWFNPDRDEMPCDPASIEGYTVRSKAGLRLVEIRYPPEGAVVHHWEFQSNEPPTSFTLPVDDFCDLLSEPVRHFTVLAIDNEGNVVKKKIDLEEI